MIPPVVASERGGAQTREVAMPRGGSRTTVSYPAREPNLPESRTIEGESPVGEPQGSVVES